MARNYSLDAFGTSYAFLTIKFFESGLKEYKVDCESFGQAVNIRMRLNTYWKVIRKVPPSQLPLDLQKWLDQVPNLTIKNKKNEPWFIITTKDERILDRVMIAAANKIPTTQTISEADVARAAEEALRKSDKADVAKVDLPYKLD